MTQDITIYDSYAAASKAHGRDWLRFVQQVTVYSDIRTGNADHTACAKVQADLHAKIRQRTSGFEGAFIIAKTPHPIDGPMASSDRPAGFVQNAIIARKWSPAAR